jgi:hypothetical protein
VPDRRRRPAGRGRDHGGGEPGFSRVLEKAALNFVRIFHQPRPYWVEGREFGDVEYTLSKDERERLNGITAG